MKKFDYSINPQTGIHRCRVWSLAGLAINDGATILYMIMMSYISYYMIGFVGVATVFATSFIAMMRVWDGVTDPFMGFLVDRTHGKFGKNRPYLVLGNVILLVFSYIMFHVTPLIPEKLRLLFFVVVTLIYYLGYTFQCIVTKSALSCLTNDPKQRSLYGMFLNVFGNVFGVIITLYVSNALVPKYGSMYSLELFHDMWKFVAVLSAVLTIIAVISIARKDREEYYGTGKVQQVRLREYIDVIGHNKALQMLVLAATTDKLAAITKTGSAVTIVLYGVVAGNYALYGGFNIYTTLAGILFAMLALGILAPKIGMRKSVTVGSIAGIIIASLSALLWLFGDPKTLCLPGYSNGYGEAFSGFTFFTAAFMLLSIIGTFFNALTTNTIVPMTADCTDYETYRSGRYVPGMIGTLFSFVDKMISSLGSVVTGLVFALIGFGSALPDVSTPETPALRYAGIFLGFGLVIIGYICNLIAMKHYPLTNEKMKEIQEEIAAIKLGNTAETSADTAPETV